MGVQNNSSKYCWIGRVFDLIYYSPYPFIRTGYHMNKRHWISVYDHDDIIRELIEDLIQISYELVVTKLKKVDRQRIEIIKSLAH